MKKYTKQTAAYVHAARNNAGRPIDSVDGATGGAGYLNRVDDPATPGSTETRSLYQESNVDPREEEALSYFSDKARYNVAEETEGAGRTTLIMMDPNDFLRLAERLPRVDTEKAARIAARMDAGQTLGDIPYLDFNNTGEGVAEVVGHEADIEQWNLPKGGSCCQFGLGHRATIPYAGTCRTGQIILTGSKEYGRSGW